jgi:serine/threonine protein phosphatase PrpC
MITIKQRNSRERIIRKESLELTNTEPILAISQEYNLGHPFLASACVLPGKDPRGNFNKVCRDFCFISSEEERLISGLFDGHGKDGEKIVSFCISEADFFFSSQVQNYSEDYTKFLEDLIQFLEFQLEQCSGIDISNSGASCLIFLICNSEIFVSNLGCNRLVLATEEQVSIVPRRHMSLHNRFQFLSEVSKARGKYLMDSLTAVQLSTDHRPDSPSETLRIVSKGGKVKRLKDEYGNYFGPYRVSPNFSSIKGLTLSRTLGDTLLKEIGISSMPQINSHAITSNDKFLVAASDGVWRVMTNKDCVDFIESHRGLCMKDTEKPPVCEIVTPANSCISQLLCEEARLRWLAKVENEDSTIDDISCVVIELPSMIEKADTMFLKTSFSEDKENELEVKENFTRKGFFGRDANR